MTPTDPADAAPSSGTPAAPRPLLAVIDASDLLGEAVVREALVRGLPVRATAPDPSLLPSLSPHLDVRAAREDDEKALATALEGVDAVALGLDPTPGPEAAGRVETTIAVVRAMRRAGVRRLVAASSLDLTGTASSVAGFARPWRQGAHALQQRRHHGGLRDLERMERLLAGSGLDWTVLRAPRLTDELGTRQQRIVPTTTPGLPGRLSREDLARALCDVAPSTKRGVFAVAV